MATSNLNSNNNSYISIDSNGNMTVAGGTITNTAGAGYHIGTSGVYTTWGNTNYPELKDVDMKPVKCKKCGKILYYSHIGIELLCEKCYNIEVLKQ